MKKTKKSISSKIAKDQTHVLRNAKYLLPKESQDFLHQIFYFQISVITCFSSHLFDKSDQYMRRDRFHGAVWKPYHPAVNIHSAHDNLDAFFGIRKGIFEARLKKTILPLFISFCSFYTTLDPFKLILKLLYC